MVFGGNQIINMRKKNPIVHFEIPADNVERAKKFYEELFGWEIKKFDYEGEPYYMIKTVEANEKGMVKMPGSINGGMMKRQNPGQVFTNYIAVEDIDSMLVSIEEKGGEALMPKTEIGAGMGWIAMFKDSEGNVMGLHEVPPEMRNKE